MTPIENKIKITKLALDALKTKKKELEIAAKKEERKKNGDALKLAVFKNQLSEVLSILDEAVLTEFNEKEPASVILGTRVTLEDLANGDKREFIIMSRATANPLKGVISNESPIAQKMMGLKLGNTFKFREIGGLEESYKIKNIE